jgi:hypothetical protein
MGDPSQGIEVLPQKAQDDTKNRPVKYPELFTRKKAHKSHNPNPCIFPTKHTNHTK